MQNELAKKECVPCKGGTPPLAGKELADFMAQLGGGWELKEGRRLEKEYRFENFREALDFTVGVGEMAERQQHHPDLYLAWGKVRVAIWTHKIDGLTESDFIFAAKADEIFSVSSLGQ